MKRSFSFGGASAVLVVAATALIAATYGLVRLAYGLFLPDVQHELALGAEPAGAISAGASVAYAGAALVGFLLSGARPLLLVAAAGLTATAGAWGMAAAPTATVFGVCAVVGSAGAGFASPALVAVLQRRPATDTTRVQSAVNAGTGPGLIAAGALALVLLPQWRLAWAIAGAFTVVVTTIVIVAGRGGAPRGRAATRPAPAWFAAHRRVLAAAALMGAGSAAVWTYGRALLVDAGVDAAGSVTAWIALGAGGALAVATASATARLSPGAMWMLCAAAIAAATASVALVAGITVAALAACVVFGAGYTAATSALIAWTTGIDPQRAPAGTAMLFVTLVLGQAVGAGAAGALLPGTGYAPTFLLAAAVTAIAAALGRPSRSARATRPAPPTSASPAAARAPDGAAPCR